MRTKEPLPTIPVFEPEVQERLLAQWSEDSSEKAATTPLKEFVWRGVTLFSRYGHAHEYETMCTMLSGVEYPQDIERLYADSKQGGAYHVTLKHPDVYDKERARELCMQLTDEIDPGRYSSIYYITVALPPEPGKLYNSYMFHPEHERPKEEDDERDDEW